MKKNGFTLIELLVALFASSVIAYAALGFYSMNSKACRAVLTSCWQEMSKTLVALKSLPAYGVKANQDTRRACRLARPN